MDKQTTLSSLKQFVSTGEITRNDVDAVFIEAQGDARGKQAGFSQVLYYIGVAIVLIGIVIFTAQNWDDLNEFTRVLVTLGSGIAAYITAVLFTQHRLSKQISPAFFFLSAFLMPLGLSIMFDQAGYNMGSSGTQLTIALILAVLYGVSYFMFKKNLLLLFAIGFATWAFFAFTGLVVGNSPVVYDWNLYTYITMALGLGYISIGYFFQNSPRKELTGVMYFFGVLGFLGATITLGGFWDVIYIGLVLGTILLSTQLRSRSFLIWGAIFLMAYIVKITGKYFYDSDNWPLMLILAGFMLIGVGYFTFYLNRKYLSNNATLRS